MTHLLERMREELVRRNYAANTIRAYLRIVRDFQQHTGKRLDRLGPDDLRQSWDQSQGGVKPGVEIRSVLRRRLQGGIQDN